MSCDADKARIPVRLQVGWTRPGPPPPIAWLNTERRLLVIPARWYPHFFWECESWTFDRATFEHYRKGFSLLQVHLRQGHGHVLYDIAADNFLRQGHSSHSCGDKDRRRYEKWHCPRRFFAYDAELEARYPAPEAPRQGVLL